MWMQDQTRDLLKSHEGDGKPKWYWGSLLSCSSLKNASEISQIPHDCGSKSDVGIVRSAATFFSWSRQCCPEARLLDKDAQKSPNQFLCFPFCSLFTLPTSPVLFNHPYHLLCKKLLSLLYHFPTEPAFDHFGPSVLLMITALLLACLETPWTLVLISYLQQLNLQ